MIRVLSVVALLVLAGCKEEEKGIGKPPASVPTKTVAAVDRTFAKLDASIAEASAAKRGKKAKEYCAHLAGKVVPKLRLAAAEAISHVPRKDTKIAADGAEWLARYISIELSERGDRLREAVATCTDDPDVKKALTELAMAALAAHAQR